MNVKQLKAVLSNTDMYLIDMIQKGYFDTPLKVLDAGCGSGRNIPLLKELGNEITAVDVAPHYIDNMLERYPNIYARVGEIGKLPFEDGTFDMIVCNAVLHFATDKQHFEDMFTDLVRVTKSGGHLFIRLVSSHTFQEHLETTNCVVQIPDGSRRFVVDYKWLKNALIPKLNLELKEPFKTVNVEDKRSMTTLVLRAK